MSQPLPLIAFTRLPAEHWVHPRTTNLIKLTFATVQYRVGAKKPATLCDLPVFVDQPAEAVTSDE